MKRVTKNGFTFNGIIVNKAVCFCNVINAAGKINNVYHLLVK